MQNRASCSTCHAKNRMQNRAKNKLFHMSRKNHAKTMQNAARTECQPECFRSGFVSMRSRRELRQVAGWLLCRAGAPNPHSPPGPCYTCCMCYMGLTRPPTEPPLFPGALLHVLYVLYGSYKASSTLRVLAIRAICAIWLLQGKPQSCLLYT